MRRKVKRKWKATYKGITAHAAALGCTRPHLWMVLTGRRESRSLTARYNALVADVAAAGAGAGDVAAANG